MSSTLSRIKFRSFLLGIFLVGLVVNPNIIHGQSKFDSIRFGKRIYISYGGVFTGNGDMWGQKLYVGSQFMFTEKIGLDLNASGSLIDHVFYLENNPDWSRNEVSNGIELSANGLLAFGKEKFRFSFSLGPTLRYSYEHQARTYGVHYNSSTGDYDWYCEYYEKQGFMFGGNLGLTFEFRIFNRFYIGPKLAMSFFPFDSYRFSYVGLNLSWK